MSHTHTHAPPPPPPGVILDVTRATRLPPLAVVQDAWARAAAARGVALRLDRLTPAHLVAIAPSVAAPAPASPAAPAGRIPREGDNFRRIGRILGDLGPLSPQGLARMRARIAHHCPGPDAPDPRGAA